MKKMKKALALFAVLALCVSVIGCTGNDDSTIEIPTGPVVEQSKESESANEPSSEVESSVSQESESVQESEPESTVESETTESSAEPEKESEPEKEPETEAEPEKEPEVTQGQGTEGSVLLFSGAENISYESGDASWLMNAKDDDIITIAYTCTDSTHGGWGIMAWGATVDDVWVEGPAYNADETNPTASTGAVMTVKELKTALGIKDNSVVTAIKLGAWNGGKIEGLYVSAPGEAPSMEEAKNVDESLITTVDPSKENLEPLTGDYLYVFENTQPFIIYPAAYSSDWALGSTVTVTVEMESNSGFSGCLSTSAGNWAWYAATYESDENNTATVTCTATPIIDTFELQVWWMGGTQIGIKSITVDVNPYGVTSESVTQPATSNEPVIQYPIIENQSITFTDSGWWTDEAITLADLLGDTDPATVNKVTFVSDTDFFVQWANTTGTSTINPEDPYWSQEGPVKKCEITDLDFGEDYNLNICLSKGDGKPYTIKWYLNDEMPEEEPGNSGATSGSVTFSDTGWWTEKEVALSDLLCGVAVSEVESITFSSTTSFIIGYNNTTGDGTADATNPNWSQADGASTYTLSNVNLDASGYYLKFILSKGDGVDYTISWTVNKKAGESGGDVSGSEAASGSVTFSDTGWWTEKEVALSDLLCGVAASEVESITFSSTTSFIVGYNNTTGDGTADATNPNWSQADGATTYTLSNVNLDASGYYLKFILSKGDGVDYTITWTINEK